MTSKHVYLNPLARERHGDAPWSFHRSMREYEMTPLVSAPGIADLLGVAAVWIKDESDRLGMPSFKILGASWAVRRAVSQRLDLALDDAIGLDDLRQALAHAAPVTLLAGTDGNHGRAVARVARLLGLGAHIYVPAAMVRSRIDAIEEEGAEVTVVDGTYDDAIAASAAAAGKDRLVISDTSWPGYEEVPAWIIDGYATIGREIDDQLAAAGAPYPNVVSLQIGVGAFAAAMVRHFRRPGTRFIGVEPTTADCVVASVKAGGLVEVPGPHDSIMAGLNCGRPSQIALPSLRADVDMFVTVDDQDARSSMRLLADIGITSGESGAAGLAGLLDACDHGLLAPNSRVLVVSTEGATDPDAYERITAGAVQRTQLNNEEGIDDGQGRYLGDLTP